MSTECVVCRAPIADEAAALYANTWERSRRRSPCCSQACCTEFSPSIHWLPATEPEPASADEQQRLLHVSRQRIAAGDNPSVIVREMLLAGVPVLALRKLVGFASAETASAAADTRRLNVLGVIAGLFTGTARIAVSRDRRSLDSLELAQADLDAWVARYSS